MELKRKEKSWQEEPGETEEQRQGEGGGGEDQKSGGSSNFFQDSVSLYSCLKVGA